MGTKCIFWPRGQEVVAASATEITVAEDVGDRSYADGIRLVCYDGTGYKAELTQDGAASGTTITVDNVAALATVGVSLDFDATYNAAAANNTIHDITTQDFGISAWVRLDSGGGTTQAIVSKLNSSSPYEGYEMHLASGKILLIMREVAAANDSYSVTGNTDIRDNKWHHIAVIIDRDNAANCKIYLDGYEDGTTAKAGTVGDVSSITNSVIFKVGSRSNNNYKFDGQLRDVILAYPADIMGAGEMGASGEILTLATGTRDLSTVNSEDYWTCNDNAADTVVTGANNNLTASANTNTFSTQEAFISRNLISDAGMENGSVGGKSNISSTVTLSKSSTQVKCDTQSLKAIYASANDNDEFTLDSLTLGNGEDYFYSFWIYIDNIDASSNLYFDIDGNANILARQLDTGTDDMGTSYAVDTWLYYEGCFQADQNGAHNLNIRITGAGAGANAATIYFEFN